MNFDDFGTLRIRTTSASGAIPIMGAIVRILGGEEANRDIINSVFDTLSEKEAEVLRLRFGIGSDKALTLAEIGEVMGVTRERIRQIETKALRKMRNPLRLKLLKEAL